MRRFVDRASVNRCLSFFLSFLISILSLGVCPYENCKLNALTNVNCNLTHELTFFSLSLLSVSTLDGRHHRRHRLHHRFCLFIVAIVFFLARMAFHFMRTRYLNVNAHTKTVRLVRLVN